MKGRYIRYAIYIASALFLLANRDFIKLVRTSIESRRLAARERKADAEFAELQKEKARILNPKDDYLERLARKELNLSKPGEIEFRFGKNDNQAVQTGSAR